MRALTLIFEHARRTPAKTALVYDGVAIDYLQFARCIAATQQHLSRLNLPPGSVAIIASANLRDAWVLLFALRSLGLSTVAARTAEDIQTLGLTHIACVVLSSAGDRQASMGPPADFPWRWVHVPRSALEATAPLVIADLPLTPAPAAGHILRTSGTTGVRKQLLRDVATESRGIEPYAQINAMTSESVVYVADYALWTGAGYRWPLTVWSLGGTVVIQPPPHLSRPLAGHDFSHVLMTPDKLTELLRDPETAPRRNETLRLMVTGGALSRALLADAVRLLTPRVYSVLAATEVSIFAVTPLLQPQDLLWHHIHPSREVQVVDEHDRLLGPGLEGQVRVRVADGLAGYLDDEAATRSHFRAGFFYPGDLGILGADGRLSLRGRASDVINVLGSKIAAAPIERALQERLRVSAVCIIALQGVVIDEELHLIIETPHAIELEQLRAARDAEFGILRALPLQVHFTAGLPRNEMGKVQRLVLRQELLRLRQGR